MTDSGQVRRERLYDLYKQNLALYDQAAGDVFVCPLCRVVFSRAALNAEPPVVTLTHIIPESQGGTTCTLACATCNSTVGQSLEAALMGQFRQEDWFAGVGTVDGRMETEFGQVTVEMRHSPPGRLWHLNVIQERSDPGQLRAIGDIVDSLRDQPNPDFRFSLKWRGWNSPLKVRAALYHSAYLLLFSHFGYEVLLRPHYDALRQWVRNPVEGSWPHNIQVLSDRSSNQILNGRRHALLLLPQQRAIMAVLRLCPRDGRQRVLGVVLPGPASDTVPEFRLNNFNCKIVPYQADALRECDWYLWRLWAEYVEEKGEQ